MLLPWIMKYKRLALTRSLLTLTCKTQHRGSQLNIRRLIYLHSEQVMQKREVLFRQKILSQKTQMFSTSSRRPWIHEILGGLIAYWPVMKWTTLLTVTVFGGLSILNWTYEERIFILTFLTGLFFAGLVALQLLFIETEVNSLTGEKILVLKDTDEFESYYEHYFRFTKNLLQPGSPLRLKGFETLRRIYVKNKDVFPQMTSFPGKWKVIPYHSSDSQPIRALSSGSIYIPTYLMEELSEDELTFLISHAMASVLMDTQRKKYARTALDDAAMLFLFGFAAFFQAPGDGLSTLLFYEVFQSYFDTAPVDQKAVLLADKYALEFTARACSDVRKIPVYLAKLAEIENQAGGRRGLYKVKNAIRSDPTFEKRRENVMSHLGEVLEIYSKTDCPKLDPENDPIVEYEIAEFERNREARKSYRTGF